MLTRVGWGVRVIGWVLFLLAGCARYHAHPLIAAAQTALRGPSHTVLTAAARRLAVPGFRPIYLNFRKPLTGKELGVIAVLANPTLRALRAHNGVAQAQVFSAGLLPDPVVQYSAMSPYGDAGAGQGSVISDGFLWDLSQLVTRDTREKVARTHAEAVADHIAWVEWITANNTRLLAHRLYWLQQEQAVVRRALPTFVRVQNLLIQDQRAHVVAQSRLTAFSVGTYAQQLEAHRLGRAIVATRERLNALLGLPPRAQVALAPPRPSRLPRQSAQQLFQQAQARRLDLRALVFAYKSASAAVLRAVLDQYPRLSLGFSGARTSAGVNQAGVQLALVVPLFGANRGPVHLAKAQRVSAFRAYVARLARARAQIYALDARGRDERQELQAFQGRQHVLRGSLRQLARAYRAHTIGAFRYLSLAAALWRVRLQILALHAAFDQTVILLKAADGSRWVGAHA